MKEALINSLMEQAQVFASAWSLVGGQFDGGNAMDDAEDAKAELRQMIEEALAQEQEPVATLFGSLPVYDTTPPQRIEQEPTWWLVEYHDWAREFVTERPEESIAVEKITALYTHPPQRTWVGLTEDERDHLAGLHLYAVKGQVEAWIEGVDDFAQAIEAKLKQKNGYAEGKNNGV